MLEEDEEDEEEDQICEVHEAQGGWNSIITRGFFFILIIVIVNIYRLEKCKSIFFGGRGQKREVYTKLNASCNVNFNGDLLQQEFNF